MIDFGRWLAQQTPIPQPPTSTVPLTEDDLPEGITEHDGAYFAACCVCGEDGPIHVDLREIPATDYQHYCGGSPRCCP